MSLRNNRSMFRQVVFGVAIGALGLAGCEEYQLRTDSIVAEHGNAVAHNIAVQTIDPWPKASRNSRIDVEGNRALIGIERYKENKSLEPKGLPTQRVIGSANGAQ